MTQPHPSRRAEFINGIRATIPLVVGAVPFGIIFGALAVSSGISAAGTVGLSALVYAGSAQFIATGLVAQNTGTLLIILTTFIVNLRHILYGATLAPHVRGLSQRWLLPLGFWLTDETFAVVIHRYNQPDSAPYKHWYWLGSSLIMYINWQISTLIGIAAGSSIPDAASWGLDFAMIVTFIGMVVPMLTSRPLIAAALVAGVVSAAAAGLPNRLGLIAAAISGVVAGLWMESRISPQRDALTEHPVEASS
ncbi:MAG: AzlC family ABC transporter permease [Anaerolinea sp.]|nr:AzlC family ABC transporter permease [Anaerolinea sp.]